MPGLDDAAQAYRPPGRPNSPFLPLLIACGGVILWLAYGAWQSYVDYSELASIRNAQAGRVEEAKKLAGALEKLMEETDAVASAGNPNAKALIDELARRGVSIKTGPAGSQAR